MSNQESEIAPGLRWAQIGKVVNKYGKRALNLLLWEKGEYQYTEPDLPFRPPPRVPSLVVGLTVDEAARLGRGLLKAAQEIDGVVH